MHRIQINLLRNEATPVYQKSVINENTCANWWKEIGISRKDLQILPTNDVCIFCHSSEDCENKFGEFLLHHFSGLRMHYFCLLLSSGLTQSKDQHKCNDYVIDEHYVYGFNIKDIFQEIKRASRLRCSFCRKQGASIGCVESFCKTKFHFPCGLEKNVISQFCDNFKSYCSKHQPKQVLKPRVLCQAASENLQDQVTLKKYRQEKISQCPICLDNIACSFDNFYSLITPCCSNVWLHRYCIQQQAYSSGLHFFRCPVCNNTKLFTQEMLRMGIYIPQRDASWELTHDAFSELLQRHGVCDKEPCTCPYGRDYNMKGSEWEVVLCDFCGSSGTHIECDPEVTCNTSYFACANCVRLYGVEGARKLAEDMGIFVGPSRRSRRIRRLSAVVSERPKRLRIDMVC